ELYADRLAEYYEMLAYHYEHAEVWEKALSYYVEAAEKSRRASANLGAVELFNQALEIGRKVVPAVTSAILPRIHLGKGELHMILSEFSKSSADYELARAAATASGDGFREVQALAGMAHSLVWAHEFERAGQIAEEANRLAHHNGYKG